MTVVTQSQNLHDIQRLEAVAERDIDLLLIEELNINEDFQSWVYESAWSAQDSKQAVIGVWHSLTHPDYGESDVVALYENTSHLKTAILIENKIDAIAQPNQAERYKSRGETGITAGWWDRYRTCIVAPESYLNSNTEADLYDVRISYEAVKSWFLKGNPDIRNLYRAEVIENAIEQSRRGYVPNPHAGVTQFWLEYWELSKSEFPQLRMRKPSKIPAQSDWPRFRPQGLDFNAVIIHKLSMGAVDLTILGASQQVEFIAAENHNLLSEDLTVLRTGKSAAVRIKVSEVDRFAGIEQQRSKAREGLRAASKLLDISYQLKIIR